jgi:hypothetical protein
MPELIVIAGNDEHFPEVGEYGVDNAPDAGDLCPVLAPK